MELATVRGRILDQGKADLFVSSLVILQLFPSTTIESVDLLKSPHLFTAVPMAAGMGEGGRTRRQLCPQLFQVCRLP